MTSFLRIAESGLSTTLQDFGRPGFQRMGVPVSGALDIVSLQAANVLAGNPRTASAIEVADIGPTLVAETGSVRLAVVGAEARLDLLPYAAATNGKTVPSNRSFTLSRGEALRVGKLKAASVLYIAVEGGFTIPHALGSLSTDVRSGIGGWNGRALQAGDRLPLRRDSASDAAELMIAPWPHARRDRIRVMLGPQSDYFSDEDIGRFLDSTYTVSSESNRMGMRLNGTRIAHAKGFNIISDAITYGSVQIMGNGQPLVMMADRPTTGGYPKIATVISADLPAIGRLPIGSPVAFEAVSALEAQAARRQFVSEMNSFLSSVSRLSDRSPKTMFEHNLISGVVDAML